MMTDSEKMSALEAILFASGESVAIGDIAAALETDSDDVIKTASMLEEKYKEGGITIIRVDDDLQLKTKKEYYEYVRRVTEPKRNAPLSHAALEVLSIVAYKQPVTRSQIDYIRGVDSSSSVSRLVMCGLIEQTGTSDAPGRPSLYSTTKEFLRVFGLQNLGELPDIGELYKELETEESDQLKIDDDSAEV